MKGLRFIFHLYALQWNSLNYSRTARSTRRMHVLITAFVAAVVFLPIAYVGITLPCVFAFVTIAAAIAGILTAQVICYVEQWNMYHAAPSTFSVPAKILFNARIAACIIAAIYISSAILLLYHCSPK